MATKEKEKENGKYLPRILGTERTTAIEERKKKEGIAYSIE